MTLIEGRHSSEFFNSVIEYQFVEREDLLSPWLKEFFEGFILNAQQIDEASYELTYRFISDAFHIQHPTCPLIPAFLVSLIKLSPNYYIRH